MNETKQMPELYNKPHQSPLSPYESIESAPPRIEQPFEAGGDADHAPFGSHAGERRERRAAFGGLSAGDRFALQPVI